MKKYIFCLLLFAANISFCQNYGSEIARIVQEFSTLDSYKIKAVVTMNHSSAEKFTASVVSSRKFGTLTKVDINEVLLNRKYAIAVDHDYKTIRVDEGDFMDKRNQSRSDVAGLEGLEQTLNSAKEILYKGEKNGERIYEIISDDIIELTIVKISSKSGFFTEIEVIYKENENLDISSYKVEYSGFEKNPSLSQKDFDENQILTKSKSGDWVPSERLKGYKIIG